MEVNMEENTGMTDRQFKIYNKLIIFALKLSINILSTNRFPVVNRGCSNGIGYPKNAGCSVSKQTSFENGISLQKASARLPKSYPFLYSTICFL